MNCVVQLCVRPWRRGLNCLVQVYESSWMKGLTVWYSSIKNLEEGAETSGTVMRKTPEEGLSCLVQFFFLELWGKYEHYGTVPCKTMKEMAVLSGTVLCETLEEGLTFLVYFSIRPWRKM